MRPIERHKVTIHLPWDGNREEGLIARVRPKAPWEYRAVKHKGTGDQPEWVVHWTLQIGTLKPTKEGFGTSPQSARTQAALAADKIHKDGYYYYGAAYTPDEPLGNRLGSGRR